MTTTSMSSMENTLPFEGAARQVLEEANQAVLTLGESLAKGQEQNRPFAETTMVFSLFYQHHECYFMTYGSIGDSRVYLLREDLALQRLTVDDGYFLWMIGKGEMNEQEAQHIEQANALDHLSEREREHFEKRNGITQSLGKKDITLQVKTMALCPGDRVLLCTDGIHDNLTDGEIETILRKKARIAVAKRLLQGAMARSQQEKAVCLRAKKDDMSAIVVTVNVP